MSGLSFVREVAALPEAQRRVLVPLVAWQLSVEHPDDFPLEGELLETVNAFIAGLAPDEPGMADRLDQQLRDAGVSPALLQELSLKANVAPLGSATFAPREPPKPGQAAGPLAAATFRSKSWKP
jgi:hypothetical protein